MRLIDADALRKCFEVPHELKCGIQAGMDEYALKCIDEQPTVAASPWHRVEDGLPEMSEIVPGYVCSEILFLCDAESKYIDIGYVRKKPDNNGVDWIWGKPFKIPTHWIPVELPKEDEDANK